MPEKLSSFAKATKDKEEKKDKKVIGKVSQIIGAVVNVEFP